MNIRNLKRKRGSTDIEILEISDKNENPDGKSGTIDVYVIINRVDMAFKSKEGNIFYDDVIEYVEWPLQTNCIMTLKYNIYEDKNGDFMQEGVNWSIDRITSISKVEKLKVYIPVTRAFLGKSKLYTGDGILLDGNKVKSKGEKLQYFVSKEIVKGKNNIYLIGQETEYIFNKVKSLDQSPIVNTIIFREKAPIYGNFNFDLGNNYSFTNSNSNLSLGTHIYSDETSLSLTGYLFKPSFLTSKKIFGSTIRTQLGLNILSSKSNLNITDAEFTSVNENDIDIDGHTYTRTNHIYNIHEDININTALLNVAARVDIDRSFTNKKGKYQSIQVGVFSNILVTSLQNTATSTINAVGNYTGEYEQFVGLIIGDDEQFERYDLGTYNLSNTKDIQMEYPPLSTFEIGAVVDWFFPNGFGVNAGLSSIISTTSITNSQTTELSNGSDNINSLLELVDEFNMHSKIKFKLGLIYKL